jgi:ABC-2 type transport system ATP-binding protein/lipopolysaccharide transport system ATP-binding protein
MDRVQVEHLSKMYRLGERGNLRETLAGLARGRVRGHKPTLWSLRDVSFNLTDGEALGVVGRNGAGKSTLLKVLMRITTPTEGVARTRGRAAALLEVGTGFHPELTGRENIFLNASVLGMSRADTQARFDEIVDFAGTERFLDTPVKRYSSGMYLRLAFAVAAHLEPDILIVDEVLAVGDAEFQRKCLTRMASAEQEGRTVVFVSHDLNTLARLCGRALWLEAGQVRDDGPTNQVVREYLTAGYTPEEVTDADPTCSGAPVRLIGARVVSSAAPPGVALLREDPLRIVVDFQVIEEQVGLDVAVYVTNARGVRVLDELVSDTQPERFSVGRHQVTLDVPPVLNVGQHVVGIWIGTSTLDLVDDASVVSFELFGSARGRPDRAVVLDLPFRRTQHNPDIELRPEQLGMRRP